MSTYDDAVSRIAGNEHGHRPRTLLDSAADTCTPDAEAVTRMLARYKPSHLLTGAELVAYEAERAARERIASRRRHLHDSGIVRVLPNPQQNIQAIVDGPRSTEALEIVRQWWAEGEPVRSWLWLSGTVGTGKTWAGAWVIADGGGRYVTCAELVRAHASLRAARGPMQVVDAETHWRRIVGAGRVLVLDELGREPFAALKDALHDLVDQRGARPTLVLSNASGKRIGEAFSSGELDARTRSRLAPLACRDSLNRPVWEVAGPDMRAGG